MIPEADFYNANHERVGWREIDYGCMWRDAFGDRTVRITWIESTGEFYLFDSGQIEVLGVLPTESEAEAALKGWGRKCGKKGSLTWARERIASGAEVARLARVTRVQRGPLSGVLAARPTR